MVGPVIRLDQSEELPVQEAEGFLIGLPDNRDGGGGVQRETGEDKGSVGS